jgi:hypothetical protein
LRDVSTFRPATGKDGDRERERADSIGVQRIRAKEEAVAGRRELKVITTGSLARLSVRSKAR